METIKSAEAGDGIIFRFYESFGMRGKANIKFGLHACKVYLCDLLEQTQKELILNGNRFILDFQPYEILTCKLILCWLSAESGKNGFTLWKNAKFFNESPQWKHVRSYPIPINPTYIGLNKQQKGYMIFSDRDKEGCL